MLIKCPRCSTTAKIGEAQEGAKVRCSACERIYVARPMGERGQRAKSGVPPAAIIGGAVVLVAFVLLMLLKDDEPKNTQASGPQKAKLVPEVTQEARIDPYSYEGEVTQFCIELHRLSLESDRGLLGSHLAGDQLLAAEKEGLSAADQPFSSLTKSNQKEHIDRWVEDLITGESSSYIKQWKPYDSDVVQLGKGTAKVHLSVSARESGNASQHTVIWDLVQVDGEWKLAGWSKLMAQKGQRDQSYAVSSAGLAKVELEDGSVVVEREAEALQHLSDSSPELRERIDSLYATMVDLDLTRESNAARDELIAIGKPAIPKLLTGLFETRLDTEDQSIKANIIVVALRNITGKNFGYQPMALSGQKDSEEYRMSAVRQWFAWWYRFGPKFTLKREGKDALEDYIEPAESDSRFPERKN